MRHLTCKRVLHVMPGGVTVRYVRPGRLLVSGQYWSREDECYFGNVRLVTESGQLLGKTKGSRSTGGIAIHPSGREYACTGYRSCTIHSFRSRRLPLIRRLEFDGHKVNSVLYTPDGRYLIWGGQGKVNPKAGWSPTIPVPPKENYSQPLLRWDTYDWSPRVLAEWGQSTCSLALSPRGETLLVGGWDGGIQLWDLARWEITAEWQSPRSEEDGKFPGVYALQLTSDRRTLYAAFGRRPYLRAFALPGFTLATPFPHEYKISSLLLLPDGRTLLTGDDHGSVTFWDTATATPVAQYSPKGKQVFTIDVLTGKSGHEVSSLGSVSDLALSPDGSTLAVGDSFGKIHLVELTP